MGRGGFSLPSRGRLKSPLPLIGVTIVLLLAGCYKSTECGSGETCNYVDDDCDNLIDEDFKNENGYYDGIEHCGGCGVNCREEFPTAGEVRCVEDAPGVFKCRILFCPPGFHDAGSGACVPDMSPSCLPCVDDGDCTLYQERSKCLMTADGSSRCMAPCPAGPCPIGYTCSDSPDDPLCMPTSGFCGCTGENVGMSVACLLASSTGDRCAGSQVCEVVEGRVRLGACTSLFEEICDDMDNDCDGDVDEDFIVDGRFVHPEHCGACNNPCVPPGPNMIATCTPADPPECILECEENFVDIDGILANGCECEYSVGSWPPSRLGVDADCDGVIDDSSLFIFVTGSGNDDGPGTLIFPMRTIPAALQRAVETGKTVLVAWGNYAGPVDLRGGVSIFGGYSPDFSERDTAVYPVVIENINGEPGHPALRCGDITIPTEMGGFTIVGSDPMSTGRGATAMYFNGCNAAVEISDLIVYAAPGADGSEGNSSSDNLSLWGMSSLADLNGENGGQGRDGIVTTMPNCVGEIIAGGSRGDRTCPGSGNTLDGGSGGDAVCPRSGCVSGEPCGNAGCTDFTVGGVCDMETVMELAVPNPAAGDGSGPGGGAAGLQTYDAPTNRFSCHFCDDNPTLRREGDNGENGGSGTDGTGGEGCRTAAGTFDIETGLWRAGDGLNGENGTDGGGGGGGTCGSGYEVIQGITDCGDAIGGSGGGGGSGGCGAPLASGGQGAGSSIAIAVKLPEGVAFGPIFENVQVISAAGGMGGDGGIGADGGISGAGGSGGQGTFWCTRRGGRGGDGGSGGAGGGGGGGGGGSVSGFHVITSNPSSINYLNQLELYNVVDVLAPAGFGGSGGFSPGHSGFGGVDGNADAFRLVNY
ncbi:MAG: hypothetical protein ABIJ56_06015 [Pseudomonadota bacterium]